jgi:SOS response regulatory protein OraA/RecX
MPQSKKTPAIDYALKYIYRYPKTEKELRVRLLEKHYSEEEIEKAIQYLKSQ